MTRKSWMASFYDPSVLNTSPNARKLRWEELMLDNRGKINVATVMKFMGDHFDTWRKKEVASGLTLCGHIDEDETGAPDMGWPSFTPAGNVQGKATDGTLAKDLQFWAIIGHPCGKSFIAKEFLELHPEFNYQKEYLHDMPGQIWTLFGKSSK